MRQSVMKGGGGLGFTPPPPNSGNPGNNTEINYQTVPNTPDRELGRIPFLYDDYRLNVLIGIVVHIILAGLLAVAIYGFIRIDFISIIAGATISFALAWYWFVSIDPGDAIALTFLNSIQSNWLLDAYWWIPRPVFSGIIYSAKEMTAKVPEISILSKKELDTSTGKDIHYEAMTVTIKESKVQWIPDSSYIYRIDPVEINNGFATYIEGQQRSKLVDKTWREIQAANTDLENEILTDKKGDLAQMCRRWGIKIFRINLGAVALPKEFEDATTDAAVQWVKRKADKINVEGGNKRLKEIADLYKSHGYSDKEALARAEIVYLAKSKDATVEYVEGSGDSVLKSASKIARSLRKP